MNRMGGSQAYTGMNKQTIASDFKYLDAAPIVENQQ